MKLTCSQFKITYDSISMLSRQSGVVKVVGVMLIGSLKRINNLNAQNREALYDEFKEWLEIDDNNLIND